MTEQENQQVQAYIASLQASHVVTMQALRTECQMYVETMQVKHRAEVGQFKNEQRARMLAVGERQKMGQAVHEIWKLAHTQSTTTPQQFATYVRQIINHYCPDFDIPY